MEAENKVRKTDDPGRGGKKRKLAAAAMEVAPAPAEGAPPSEAEVEEFFAIVRRMHVAVKYFERAAAAGGGGAGAAGDDRGKGWRSALESGAGFAAAAEEIDGDGDGAGDGEAEDGVKKEGPDGAAAARAGGGGFDLNAVPEGGPGED
ncbi:hypothetical protein ACJRO7_009925 [Eucalyptus globulus]|uniref:Uncharacterized protein n=1 Tax=Eucalyptus globulus TaxID=34317 RepID=A0ABD3LAD2_EUCGL